MHSRTEIIENIPMYKYALAILAGFIRYIWNANAGRYAINTCSKVSLRASITHSLPLSSINQYASIKSYKGVGNNHIIVFFC